MAPPTKFEEALAAEIQYDKARLLGQIDGILDDILGIKHKVEKDRKLNSLGELQAQGIFLDTAIAAYVAKCNIMESYQKLKTS